MAHDPEFDPTEDELDLIAQLTRRLDGIPLAIEMAAGLIGTLDVREIVSRLDDRFRLLTGGSGRTLGRQQTLLATVEWSHDLLRPPEQVLLRRLATMSGTFSLDAVEAICAGDGLELTEMVQLLRRLVATSWLIKERGTTPTRYRMLETSRQYAVERLIASSEAERFRYRHDEWFLELAENAAGFLLGGPEQANWFDRVELELDNLRTALAWSLGEGDATVALRISTALTRFWDVRGHWTEALRWLEQALERASAAPAHLRAPALVSASFMAFYRGSLDVARAHVEEGLAAAREAGDDVSEARGMRFLAVTEQRSGNEDVALDLADRAVALSRSTGVGADLAFALQVLGRLTSDPREARVIFSEGLSVARAAEDGVSQIYLLYALGQLAIRMQDEAEAREHFNEALGIAHRLRERWMAMNVLVALSRVSEEIDAGSAVEEMIGLLRQIGNRLMLVRWLRQLAYLRRMEGDVVGARRLVDEALSVVEQEGTDEAKALGHFILADSSTRRRSITFPLCGNSRLGFVSHTTSDRSGKRRLVSARSGASWLSLETTRVRQRCWGPRRRAERSLACSPHAAGRKSFARPLTKWLRSSAMPNSRAFGNWGDRCHWRMSWRSRRRVEPQARASVLDARSDNTATLRADLSFSCGGELIARYCDRSACPDFEFYRSAPTEAGLGGVGPQAWPFRGQVIQQAARRPSKLTAKGEEEGP